VESYNETEHSSSGSLAAALDAAQSAALAAPLFWVDAVRLDMLRLLAGGGDMGLGWVARTAAAPAMLALRQVDLVGIVAALRGKPVPQR